jgi:hypothetical protein
MNSEVQELIKAVQEDRTEDAKKIAESLSPKVSPEEQETYAMFNFFTGLGEVTPEVYETPFFKEVKIFMEKYIGDTSEVHVPTLSAITTKNHKTRKMLLLHLIATMPEEVSFVFTWYGILDKLAKEQ